MPILGIIASSFRSAAGPEGAYDALATVTVPSGGFATVSFVGIPSGYKHLQIRYIARTNTGASNQDQVHMRFNSDAGSNYAWHRLLGDGASASAAAATSQTYINTGTAARNGEPSNVFGVGVIDILDYQNTNKNKTTRTLTGEDANSGSDEFIGLYSGLWTSTSAVSQIDIFSTGASFLQYSSFALYGIK